MNKHLRFSGSTFSKLDEHGVSASTILRRAGLPQEYAKQPTVRLKWAGRCEVDDEQNGGYARAGDVLSTTWAFSIKWGLQLAG